MRSMRIRLQKKQIFMALFVMIYISRAFTDAVFIAQNKDSVLTLVKYAFLFLTMIYGLELLQHKRKWTSTYIIKDVVIVVMVFILISLFKMMYEGIFSTAVFSFSFRLIFDFEIAFEGDQPIIHRNVLSRAFWCLRSGCWASCCGFAAARCLL